MQLARYVKAFQKRLLLSSLGNTSKPSTTLFMTHSLSSVNKYCLYSPRASSLTSLIFGAEEEKNDM